MQVTEPQTMSLQKALTISEKQRALYQHGELRAFVSRRDQNYDLGLAGMELNISWLTLVQRLTEKSIPLDGGWIAQ